MDVIAKFTSRPKADEAVRALRSHGYAAELIDYPAGSDDNVRRLGDHRVAVPEPEIDGALSVLSELYPDASIHEGAGAGAYALSAAPIVLTPPLGFEAPWLSLRRKSSWFSELLGIVSVPFVVVAALALAAFVLKAIYNLITYGQFF